MKIKELKNLKDLSSIINKDVEIMYLEGKIVFINNSYFRFEEHARADGSPSADIYFTFYEDGEREIEFLDDIKLEFKDDKNFIKVKECQRGDYVEYQNQKGYIIKDTKTNDGYLICFDTMESDIGWTTVGETRDCLGKKFAWWIYEHEKVKLLSRASDSPSSRTLTEQMIRKAEFKLGDFSDLVVPLLPEKYPLPETFKELFTTYFIHSKQDKPMSLIKKFQGLFVKEPQKTFRKLEITTQEDQLTSEGRELFINWLFQKHQDEFKTEVADKLLAEMEKESKCDSE